jgi:CheY-like chemotaxis protein
LNSAHQSASLPLILVAEDDENDVFFLRRALLKAGFGNPLVALCDGQAAVDYLEGVGIYADRKTHPLPGLLLLDLKMPRKSGFEVLAWLNERPELSQFPVVVLSSSVLESDKQKALALGAVEYRVKPSKAQDLVQLIEELHSRWLSGRQMAEEKSGTNENP